MDVAVQSILIFVLAAAQLVDPAYKMLASVYRAVRQVWAYGQTSRDETSLRPGKERLHVWPWERDEVD